jgi:hypothetical protein
MQPNKREGGICVHFGDRIAIGHEEERRERRRAKKKFQEIYG